MTLNKDALSILQPTKEHLTVHVQNGLVVIQTGDKWVAMTKKETIALVQALANAANSLMF